MIFDSNLKWEQQYDQDIKAANHNLHAKYFKVFQRRRKEDTANFTYLHLLLHKPVKIENIVPWSKLSRGHLVDKQTVVKRAVSRVSVKKTGVPPSTLACSLVLFVCH